jgi:hypothetical protein
VCQKIYRLQLESALIHVWWLRVMRYPQIVKALNVDQCDAARGLLACLKVHILGEAAESPPRLRLLAEILGLAGRNSVQSGVSLSEEE